MSPSARHSDQLALMPYGMAIARRGWASPRLVLNTLPAQEMIRWAGEWRGASGHGA